MRPGAGWLSVGLVGWGLLALPSGRAALEATLPGHMVAQLGLLAAVGWCLGRSRGPVAPGELGGWNRYGATGVVAAVLTLAFWMLPLSLDFALQEPAWEAAKFLTVPLLAGLPLARSWVRLPGLARALIWAHLLPMLAVMGWIYHEAPGRLCNAYLLDQQALLAWTLWGLAAAIAAFWTIRAFPGRPPPQGALPTGPRLLSPSPIMDEAQPFLARPPRRARHPGKAASGESSLIRDPVEQG